MDTKKIEIFENTLLKLLVRRGSNTDRLNVTLGEGELGYTTDNKRLYVGDGQTKGGIVTGNVYLGTRSNVTTFTNAVSGDYALDSDDNKFYIYRGGDPTVNNNWQNVGGVYAAGNGTISVSTTNLVTVDKLSANNFSTDAVGNSIAIDSSGRISLSSTQIKTDKINTSSATYLGLPGNLAISNVNYTWPSGGVGTNLYLTTDISGNLSWSNLAAPTTVFVSGTASQIPVGSIMPFVSSANAPVGWLLCNGQAVSGTSYRELSAVIGTTYGGNTITFNVPNYINKTLYGVANSPATSTLYSISSGTNSALSATGALYIIKAKPDNIAVASLTVNNGLSAVVNGIDQTGVTFNSLSGNINLALPTLITSQTVVGGSSFTVDTYGRVTSVASVSSVTYPAGQIYSYPPTNTQILNSTSPISFLQVPVTIASESVNNSFSSTISAWPKITNTAGTVTAYSIPANAKNVIVDCNIYKNGPDDGDYKNRWVVAAANVNLLNADTNFDGVGTYEYLVGSSRASGKGDSIQSASQVFLPLSANSIGALTFGLRARYSSNDTFTVRIVGYTI
jgi:hypothetical protein